MNEFQSQQCSISDTILDQQQNSVDLSSHSYNDMLQKLKYQINLKDHAIQTASHLIYQLRQQNTKLHQQYKRQIHTRDKAIQDLTNKIVEVQQKYKYMVEQNKKLIQTNKQQQILMDNKKSAVVPVVKILKETILSNNNYREDFQILQRKQQQKIKLKNRFKNYLNLSNYDTKNTSVAAFDCQNQQQHNSSHNNINKQEVNQNRISLNKRLSSQKVIETTKKSGIVENKKNNLSIQTQKNVNKKNNEELRNKQQFYMMMNEIKLLKGRVDEKDDQILLMMKRNKQVQDRYNSLLQKLRNPKSNNMYSYNNNHNYSYNSLTQNNSNSSKLLY